MKFNDDITQSIAATVSDVLEGKATKKEEVKYPHDMFHPETGEKEVAKTPEDHEKLAAKGYTHEKPKVNEVEEPRAKGEKDFKDKHVVKKSGENPDGTVTKEAKDDEVDEESEKQKKYQAFFNKALKKFGVKSPAELEGDKKKEFFDYVDANYEADNETDESVKEEVEQVDEILGFVKKVKDKITGKDKPKYKAGTSNDGSDDIGQMLMDKIDKQKEKLKKTREKLKHAQGPDGSDESEDYWGELEMKQNNELEELEARLKKVMDEK